MPWILESLVSTLNNDGSTNIAPQGPIVLVPGKEYLFRPFLGSHTFANLMREKCGVLHIVDDPLMLVKAALGKVDPLPETVTAKKIAGEVIQSACRYFEFRITKIEAVEQRSEMHAKVVYKKTLRDFSGWNRAAHALIEMAIVCTRLHITEQRMVLGELRRCAAIVQKTGAERETEALEFILHYLESKGIQVGE